ncbi:conserved hypothetical protein [Rhodococcus sp. RD6.2]|uniref:hypothetical protein n=1 Tax=Rhodococcus sp. RD6.2 TaxID=260936 RepID=UPI00063B2318|nr:hypothetical protein [Rhodococcus sp. RD6.2]CRK50433.1 conserved hypothetical protein [Rhodococcus sp. RD6.2]
MTYADLPELVGVYLEDSYVLSIEAAPHRFSFTLDAVLRSEHPRYHPPVPGEQYCYARAELTFDDVTELVWLSRTAVGFTYATGEPDVGNIDSLTVETQDRYLLEGDWGRVRIRCPRPPRLVLDT